MKKAKKRFTSVQAMPDGLRQYTEKLIRNTDSINSRINTFTSCLYGQLLATSSGDEIIISENLNTISKMITKSVINTACASNWCEFFQELADGLQPQAMEDIRQAVIVSLIRSFNWQIAHYLPISIIGKLEVKTLKCTSYKPTHVFSKKDYKIIVTSPLDEAKRSARRYIDKQRGVRIDYKDQDGKNHTYIARPDSIENMEDWQADNMYYRFTMENLTDENGGLIDYCDMSMNEYFVSALHDVYEAGTITKKDYDMACLILNGLSYEDVGRLKECSKQYVGKRMLLVYKALNEYIMTEQDYMLGDRPAEVERMIEKYGGLIDELKD